MASVMRSRSSRMGRKWSMVSAWVTMSSSRPSYSSRLTLVERLEPAAEAALGLAHPLGHGPHLAVAGGRQDDDAVGLAQLLGAQHHALVAVQGHGSAEVAVVGVVGRAGCRRSAGPGAGTPGPPRPGARRGSRATARR